MKKIGITGQEGFVGSHLYNALSLYKSEFELVPYKRSYFERDEDLDAFVGKCDVIVHLAAMNRHTDPQVIYDINIKLVKKLIQSLERTHSKAHILFSSSSQEHLDNLYGKSKKEGRELLSNWAKQAGGVFTGLVIPNVFGPFGQPNYNSFIATFCHKLTHGETPEVHQDSEVNLIYVGELVDEIIRQIRKGEGENLYAIPFTSTYKVTTVLSKLKHYKATYFDKGEIPQLGTTFDLQLFNTYRSYIDYSQHFPIKFTKHSDERGAFVEIIRLGIGGQCSFSTTVPTVTRGNHFHTRKIERFAVIKGKARIQLRKVNTDEVLDFYLDGNEPSYVDMPIWYTHNIKNIGEDELVTIFWINEPYNPEDADTYFLEV
ncbi:NAD-dependent epimerase/dehydratase family protein [Riemerella anatipestifer]|nr:NAD-dependent epimerase/dehydratase family protein [Riemerella anatipestifer]MDY3517947.1 NAD-dependent epimerase/dehydratase family protein [Riemerella anatipestifer]MDY3542933.1 NAD-dependent epimerase/dehydratase family protein [Riemerella anatipestifer]